MTNEQEKAVQVVRDALAYARRTGLTNDQAFQAAAIDPAPSLKGGMDVLSGGSIRLTAIQPNQFRLQRIQSHRTNKVRSGGFN
jgi:hypothetical protein